MLGVFACPECGTEVELSGLSPGRQVRCECCETLIEVPYFRRHTAAPRRGYQRSLRKLWITLGVIGGVLLIAVLVGSIVSKGYREGSRKEILELSARADQDEVEGDFESALRNTMAALELANRGGVKEGLDELRRKREKRSRRDVAQKLAALDALSPDQALGSAATLAKRAEEDVALASLRDQILSAVTTAQSRCGQVTLDEARNAINRKQYSEALALCERLLTLQPTTVDVNEVLQADAKSLIAEIASRVGVLQVPLEGRFLLGSVASYQQKVIAPLEKALLSRGYLPTPKSAALRQIWEEQAMYRLAVEVTESQEARYLQSENRASRIELKVTLSRGGATVWQTQAAGRTRIPPHNMTAYEAGHLSTSTKRSPDAERKLYEDAIDAMVEHLSGRLRGFPAPEG